MESNITYIQLSDLVNASYNTLENADVQTVGQNVKRDEGAIVSRGSSISNNESILIYRE